MTTSRDTGTQHKLRMPPDLKEKLFQSAKDMNRSLNAEIVARLEESFATGLVASDPYKRMLLAVIAGIVAEQADNEKPSFKEAIDRITKAVMINEKYLYDINKDNKKAP